MSEGTTLPKLLFRYMVNSVTITVSGIVWSLAYTAPVFVLAILTDLVVFYSVAVVIFALSIAQITVRDAKMEYSLKGELPAENSRDEMASRFITALYTNMMFAIAIVIGSITLHATDNAAVALLLAGAYPTVDTHLQEIRWWLSPSMAPAAIVMALAGHLPELSNYHLPHTNYGHEVLVRIRRRIG